MAKYEREPLLKEGQISEVYGLPLYEKVDVQKMIEEAYARGDKKVVIPPGAYRIHAGDNPAHIYLKDMKDFTVEAYDVVFVCQDFQRSGVQVNNCERVKVAGFAIDMEPYGYFQSEITAFDPEGNYFDVYIEKGYQSDFSDPITVPKCFPGDFYDGKTYDRIDSIRGTGYFNAEMVEPLDDYHFRLHIKVQSDWKDRVKVGDFFCFSSRPVIRGGFSSVGNSYLHVKDVKVWAGICGVGESGAKKQSFYENFRVEPGPKPYGAKNPRICSTVADACHMSNNYEGARMENCVFDHAGDDGINFYGLFSRVAEQLSPDTVIFANKSHLPISPRERLRFYDMETEKIGEAVTVEAEQMPKDYKPPINLERHMGAALFVPYAYYKVRLDREVSLNPGDWMSNSAQVGNGFILKNNLYTNLRPRGALIKASNGLIENCTFHNLGAAGVQIRPEFEWTESGYAHNVVIRNCIFDNCGEHGDSSAIVVSGSGARAQDQKDIVIEDNTFIRNNHIEISLSQAENIMIRDNHFAIDRQNQDSPIVLLKNGKGFHFENNTFGDNSVPVGAGNEPTEIHGATPAYYTVCSAALATGNQGVDGWHFQYAPIGTDDYQDFDTFVYSDKLQDGWWNGEEENYDDGCIRRWWFDTYLLPGEKSDVAKTFVCPKDGEILINAASFIVGAPTTDGINVCVRKNAEQLWPQGEDWETKFEGVNPPFTPFTVAVQKGDQIHFRVNKNGNTENDGLDWNPTILYRN